jgi:hypothetical protein
LLGAIFKSTFVGLALGAVLRFCRLPQFLESLRVKRAMRGV